MINVQCDNRIYDEYEQYRMKENRKEKYFADFNLATS